MSLIPGTRLGACEVIAPLGAGGMGEVYRARDTRLHRDVALKVLPRSIAGDADSNASEAPGRPPLNHRHEQRADAHASATGTSQQRSSVARRETFEPAISIARFGATTRSHRRRNGSSLASAVYQQRHAELCDISNHHRCLDRDSP
jgi:serine/threonine protein kinase